MFSRTNTISDGVRLLVQAIGIVALLMLIWLRPMPSASASAGDPLSTTAPVSSMPAEALEPLAEGETAITLTLREAAPVVAMKAGQVVHVGPFYQEGCCETTVVVEHEEDQLYSAYIHLHEPVVTLGQAVVAGQTLGTTSRVPTDFSKYRTSIEIYRGDFSMQWPVPWVEGGHYDTLGNLLAAPRESVPSVKDMGALTRYYLTLGVVMLVVIALTLSSISRFGVITNLLVAAIASMMFLLGTGVYQRLHIPTPEMVSYIVADAQSVEVFADCALTQSLQKAIPPGTEVAGRPYTCVESGATVIAVPYITDRGGVEDGFVGAFRLQPIQEELQ